MLLLLPLLQRRVRQSHLQSITRQLSAAYHEVQSPSARLFGAVRFR
jgi:hypothetical protein